MAIGASSVWEYQTGGNNNNGGGFDSTISGAGTDYSQQATAALALTDIAYTANSTTITSATGGFTAAMIGNALNLYTVNGVGNSTGFYFIVAVADTNTATIDRVIGTANNMTSGDGNVGGCLAVPIDAHLELFVGGNKVWIKAGNYTLLATVSVASTSASGTAPIWASGYYASRGDMPIGDYRPYLNATTYAFFVSGFWIVEHIRSDCNSDNSALGTASTNGATFINCKSTNVKAAKNGFNSAGPSLFYLCEGSGPGSAFSQTGTTRYVKCLARDSGTGVLAGTNSAPILTDCVVGGCTTGVSMPTNANFMSITHCVFYDNVTHINMNGSKRGVVSESIFHTSTTAITDSTNGDQTQIKYNLFYNNNTNGTNVTIDSTNLTGSDPLFTDAANNDFTLQSGSPALNAGPALTMIGLTGAYKWNIGLDQDDNAAASGGTPFYAWAA